jgi:serine/threonine-protein kinase
MTYCPQCGTANLDATRFCTTCGASLTATVAARTPAESEPADPLLGRTIEGKYRFDVKLGAGGMGAVYKATRLLIGDTVAIKVLHPAMMNTAQAGERFRREAQAAARLKHPNAVTIYDFGVTGDGLLYLIMELAEGQSLRDLIQEKGPIAPPMAAEIMRQAGAALDEAHRHNIVHRDIKPDNIMVKNTPGGMQVKVLDFGIAKLRDLAGADTLTQHGSVIGTPHYMSPEQCLGEELDGRSDVYSLGVVLYEMLSGVAPFRGNTSREIITKHISQPPPPLSSLRNELSPEIESVVHQALAKDREARPQFAGILAKALTNAIALSTPTATRPVTPAQPMTPPGGVRTPSHPNPVFHPPTPATPIPAYQPLPPGYVEPHKPTPRKRGWFLPFLIGGILAFVVLFFILLVIGLMVEESGKNNITPTVTPPAISSDPPASVSPDNLNTVPVATTGPVKIIANASSSRADFRGIRYGPDQALDGSMLTAWIEGAQGPGEGEWIQFDFSREVRLKRMLIAPGYFKSEEIWAKNNRLSEVTLVFSDGSTRQFIFRDNMNEHAVDLGGIATTSVRIIIDVVHPGTTDTEDTAISQVAFEYESETSKR